MKDINKILKANTTLRNFENRIRSVFYHTQYKTRKEYGYIIMLLQKSRQHFTDPFIAYTIFFKYINMSNKELYKSDILYYDMKSLRKIHKVISTEIRFNERNCNKGYLER